MRQAAATKVSLPLEAVDSNGLLPLRAATKGYPTAYAFRRFLQKTLPGHLFDFPQANPLKGIDLPRLEKLPDKVQQNWPPASNELLAADPAILALLPIDHSVAATDEQGGGKEAESYLQRFLNERLPHYLQRSEPEKPVSSELSPIFILARYPVIRYLFNWPNRKTGRSASSARKPKVSAAAGGE